MKKIRLERVFDGGVSHGKHRGKDGEPYDCPQQVAGFCLWVDDEAVALLTRDEVHELSDILFAVGLDA